MKWYEHCVFLIMLIMSIWIMWPMISRTFSEGNATSTDGNSTAPFNLWSLVQTFFTTPSFLWLIPVFIVSLIISKMLTSGLSDGEASCSSEDRPYPSYIETRAEEEEEEDIAQIRPTGDLQDLKCPKCSAPLSFHENRDLTKCGYCGSQVQRRIEEEQ